MADSITVNRDSASKEQLSVNNEHSNKPDFKIFVGKTKETFQCHSCIISNFSPVMKRMLETDMAEGIHKTMTFDTIEPKVMKMIISYVYSGTVTIEQSYLKELVKTCDYLEILELRDGILEQVSRNLTPNNVIGWLRLAGRLQLDTFAEKCQEIVLVSFKQITKGHEFVELHLEELKFVLQAAAINVLPDDLLHSLFSWITFDVDSRVTALGLQDVPNIIKFESCSSLVLNKIITQFKQIIDKSPVVHNAIQSVFQTRKTGLVVTGGFDNKKCWEFDSNQFKDMNIPQIPDDKYDVFHSICLYQGVGCIATGGFYGNACSLYHVAAKQWKRLRNLRMTKHHVFHASACVCGELFIFGGVNFREWSTGVEYLHIEEEHNEWRSAPPIPSTFERPKAACLETQVFIMEDFNPKFYHFDALQKVHLA